MDRACNSIHAGSVAARLACSVAAQSIFVFVYSANSADVIESGSAGGSPTASL